MVYDLYIYPNTLMTWFCTFVKHWEGVSFVHVFNCFAFDYERGILNFGWRLMDRDKDI